MTPRPLAHAFPSRTTTVDEINYVVSAAMLTFAPTDEMRWLTRTVAIGATTAIVLAVIGGMPLALPMPTHAIGVVDPTCGLTRASTAIARGDFVNAWRFNPAAFLLAAAAVAVAARTAYGLTTRRWLTVRFAWNRLRVAAAVVVFAGWWAYQQTNAEFIMHTRYP